MSDFTSARLVVKIGGYCEMRHHLREFQQLGYHIMWHEGPGWFLREYDFWGDAKDVRRVYHWLQNNFMLADEM